MCLNIAAASRPDGFDASPADGHNKSGQYEHQPASRFGDGSRRRCCGEGSRVSEILLPDVVVPMVDHSIGHATWPPAIGRGKRLTTAQRVAPDNENAPGDAVGQVESLALYIALKNAWRCGDSLNGSTAPIHGVLVLPFKLQWPRPVSDSRRTRRGLGSSKWLPPVR